MGIKTGPVRFKNNRTLPPLMRYALFIQTPIQIICEFQVSERV